MSYYDFPELNIGYNILVEFCWELNSISPPDVKTCVFRNERKERKKKRKMAKRRRDKRHLYDRVGRRVCFYCFTSKRETRKASGLLWITVINKTKSVCVCLCVHTWDDHHFLDSSRVLLCARMCANIHKRSSPCACMQIAALWSRMEFQYRFEISYHRRMRIFVRQKSEIKTNNLEDQLNVNFVIITKKLQSFLSYARYIISILWNERSRNIS